MNSAPIEEFIAWRPEDEDFRLRQFAAIRKDRRATSSSSYGPVTSFGIPVPLSEVLLEPTDSNEWLIENLLAKGGLAMHLG